MGIVYLNCELADIVEFVSRMIDGRDPNLHQHHARMGALCGAYAEHVGMSAEDTQLLVFGAMMHDIGKVGIALAVIDKVTPLTANEMESIRRHTNYGHEYAQPLGLPKQVLDVILYHHENFNGTGYHGLVGDNIPEFARIVRVADSIDAIQHARAYKHMAKDVDEVIASLRKLSAHYDARVLAVFIEIMNSSKSKAGGEKHHAP